MNRELSLRQLLALTIEGDGVYRSGTDGQFTGSYLSATEIQLTSLGSVPSNSSFIGFLRYYIDTDGYWSVEAYTPAEIRFLFDSGTAVLAVAANDLNNGEVQPFQPTDEFIVFFRAARFGDTGNNSRAVTETDKDSDKVLEPDSYQGTSVVDDDYDIDIDMAGYNQPSFQCDLYGGTGHVDTGLTLTLLGQIGTNPTFLPITEDLIGMSSLIAAVDKTVQKIIEINESLNITTLRIRLTAATGGTDTANYRVDVREIYS